MLATSPQRGEVNRANRRGRGLIRSFLADQRGNVAVIGAGLLLLVLGCAALVVDVGTMFADKRKAQSAADLAAIVAASDLTHASAAASAAMTSNNYAPGSLVAVELGAYSADASLTPAQRFVTPATNANAVRVKMLTQTPLYFGRVLTGTSQFNLNTTAIAATTQLASFAIGSRLVSVNGGTAEFPFRRHAGDIAVVVRHGLSGADERQYRCVRFHDGTGDPRQPERHHLQRGPEQQP